MQQSINIKTHYEGSFCLCSQMVSSMPRYVFCLSLAVRSSRAVSDLCKVACMETNTAFFWHRQKSNHSSLPSPTASSQFPPQRLLGYSKHSLPKHSVFAFPTPRLLRSTLLPSLLYVQINFTKGPLREHTVYGHSFSVWLTPYHNGL